MISRIPLISVLCAVLFGAFGHIAVSAAKSGFVIATTNGDPNEVAMILQRIFDTNHTYSASNYAKPEAPILETRTFKIDTNSLAEWQQVARSLGGADVDHPTTTSGLVKLLSRGMYLSPPKSILFDETNGVLFVCATASELAKIEDNIEGLYPPHIYVKARFIEAPEDAVESILRAGTVVDGGVTNTVEIITSDKIKPLIGQLASNTNLLFCGGRPGMLEFLNGRGGTGMLFHNRQMGEFVIGSDVFTNSAYVPPPNTNTTTSSISSYPNDNLQSYAITPTLLDDGTTFRMQVTSTASLKKTPASTANSNYSYISDIPIGKVDVRIRDGETLVLVSPNMATGRTNRLVAFFTATKITPAKTPVRSGDELLGPSL